MKKYQSVSARVLFALLSVSAFQASAFAAINCSAEIKEKALEQAQLDGFESCRVGEPKLSQALELRSEYGSIGLICQHHISQISVVTEPVSYLFTAAAGDCSSVAIDVISAQ